MTDINESTEKINDPDPFMESNDPDLAAQDDIAANLSARPGRIPFFRQRFSWQRALGVVAGGVAVALAVIFWNGLFSRGPARESLHTPGRIVLPVPGKQELHLNDFLIPMAADKSETGVAFSLRIQSKDAAFIEMSTQEKVWLRAHIYDTLLNQAHKEIEPPSQDMVTYWTNRTLKKIFPDRSIDPVVVYNFSVL
jgi:hypothetical protein